MDGRLHWRLLPSNCKLDAGLLLDFFLNLKIAIDRLVAERERVEEESRVHPAKVRVKFIESQHVAQVTCAPPSPDVTLDFISDTMTSPTSEHSPDYHRQIRIQMSLASEYSAKFKACLIARNSERKTEQLSGAKNPLGHRMFQGTLDTRSPMLARLLSGRPDLAPTGSAPMLLTTIKCILPLKGAPFISWPKIYSCLAPIPLLAFFFFLPRHPTHVNVCLCWM
ncbi:uncharacterized protein CEXT_109431 [Caerostris extrusa]|uniref:Uncharacterized protein n=1 Tax=Caerostris extrusa TaxID=172846 RepID=A0AAV4WS52_CAEEX|nr:uncharacterized protein CEXT_109431 [Caerostris extrusa]